MTTEQQLDQTILELSNLNNSITPILPPPSPNNMAAMPCEGTDGGGQPRMRTPVPVRGEGGGGAAARMRAAFP